MKKRWLVVVVLAAVVIVAVLCRTWTWAAPFPAVLSVKVAEAWTDEQPWVQRAGVWSAAMPKLTARLNSAGFLQALKERLADHSVVSAWTSANTEFEPAQLSPGGPLVVVCEVPSYGVRRWSILGQGAGRDAEKTRQLRDDLQAALHELLKPAPEAAEADSERSTAPTARAEPQSR